MAVAEVSTTVVKPDQFENFLEFARKMKTIMEGYGARCRLLSAVVGGEATGSVTFINEVDDWNAFGAVMSKFYADAEALAALGSATSSDGPIGSYQSTVWVDIPL